MVRARPAGARVEPARATAAAYGAARSIANGTRPRVHSGGVSCSNRLLGETLVFANCLAATECFTLWKLFFPELVYKICFSRNLNKRYRSKLYFVKRFVFFLKMFFTNLHRCNGKL